MVVPTGELPGAEARGVVVAFGPDNCLASLHVVQLDAVQHQAHFGRCRPDGHPGLAWGGLFYSKIPAGI